MAEITKRLAEAGSPLERAFEADTQIFPIVFEWWVRSELGGGNIGFKVRNPQGEMRNVSKAMQPRITKALRTAGLVGNEYGDRLGKSMGGNPLYPTRDLKKAHAYFQALFPDYEPVMDSLSRSKEEGGRARCSSFEELAALIAKFDPARV